MQPIIFGRGSQSMHLNADNAPAFGARRVEVAPSVFDDENMDPTILHKPSVDSVYHSGPFNSLDDVVDGLGLPEETRKRLRKGLQDVGKGRDALRQAIVGPLAELRDDTRDSFVTRTAGLRFAAFLGNGLVKASFPAWVQETAPGVQRFHDELVKSAVPLGTVHTWATGLHEKTAKGWRPVSRAKGAMPKLGELHPTKPTAIFSMGLPASGKSYMLGTHYGEHLKAGRLINLDPDEIKKEHPDYNVKNPNATHAWSQARTAERWDTALGGRKNVVLDGTGTNAERLVHRIEQAKERGYYTAVLFVTVPLEVSLERNSKRARVVPEHVIREKAETVRTAYKIVKPFVEAVHIVDNSKTRKDLLGKSLSKSGPMQPPPGFSPIPGSTKGGWHKKTGAGWLYFYPGQGITREPQEDPGQQQPGAQKPQPGQRQPAQQQPQPKQGAQPEEPPKKPGMGEPSEAKEGEAQKPTLSDRLDGMEPKAFNELSKMERAQKTAKYADIAAEMEIYASPEDYQRDSMSGAYSSVAKHVRQLVSDGAIGSSAADRVLEISSVMGKYARSAGVSSEGFADLMERNVQKLVLLETKSAERTLGDHGIRHMSVNIKNVHNVMNALKTGGVPMTPMDYLMAAQIMVDHDLGYTIPAIHEGGFAVKDNYHPAASRVLWEQQPEMGSIFGKENADKMAVIIEEHSGKDLDWEKNPLGAAVRMADNTHLFADKMPEILFDSSKGVELMTKLALLKKLYAEGSKEAGEGVDSLKKALVAHIDDRADISPAERARLHRAAKEIGPKTDVYLASRLAGRNPKFRFEMGTLHVDIEHSDARAAVGEVFGPDQADKQFGKLLKDFGLSKVDVAKISGPPPAVSIGIPPDGAGKEQALFHWSKGKTEDKIEKRFAEVMTSTQGEWKKLGAITDERKKKAAMDIFFGELSKAFWNLGRWPA